MLHETNYNNVSIYLPQTCSSFSRITRHVGIMRVGAFYGLVLAVLVLHFTVSNAKVDPLVISESKTPNLQNTYRCGSRLCLSVRP